MNEISSEYTDISQDINRDIKKDIVSYARKRIYYKEHPVEFIEENVKIPAPGGSKLMKLYEPQKRIIKSFFKNHELILLKSRQIGMSTLSQAIITYIFTFYDNCVVGIISRDSGESSDFCRKVQDMIDNLPEWIRPKYKNKSIQYFILRNGCQLHTSAISPANPGSVFRSKSITLLIIDEAAHIRNIDVAWTAVAPALSKVQQVAAEKDIPYGTIILSTPNKTQGIGKWYAQMWIEARAKKNAFHAHQIHWREIPDFANDPGWYKKQCKLLNNDPNRIAQELDLQFVSSENSLFTESVQRRLQVCYKKPEEIVALPGIKGKGELWRFKPIDRSHFYIIGVDCATASGSDNSAIEVIDYETMEQVMEYSGKLEPKEFADVVRIVCAHCPHNIVVVENTGGYGQVVITELVYDEHVNYNVYGEMTGKDKNMFVPGLSTNSKTRPLILDALHDYISHDPDIIYSERLANELLGLVNKGTRIEADAGFNDDLCLAYGFCCYVRKYKPDLLGDVRSLDDDEVRQIMSDKSLSTFLGMFGDNAPLLGYRMLAENSQDNIDFQKTVDKFIKEKINSGQMSGVIDVSRLLGGLIPNLYNR